MPQVTPMIIHVALLISTTNNFDSDFWLSNRRPSFLSHKSTALISLHRHILIQSLPHIKSYYHSSFSLILTSYSVFLTFNNRAMSSSKKKLIFNTVAVDIGCSNCRKPKISNIFYPKPKPRKLQTQNYSSSGSWDNDDTTTTFSSYAGRSSQFSGDVTAAKKVKGLGRVGGEGVAVEKDSDDPYLDFRQSMLQMIVENEIYTKEDLRELLRCFLLLNSPYHHGVIVRAFTEIWNGMYSLKPNNSPKFHLSLKSRES